MNRILYILITIVAISTIELNAQSQKAFEKAGANAFIQKDYYNALTYFLNAGEFDSTRMDIQYKIAESARLFNAYALAEEKYQFIIDNETDGQFPLAGFWFADMKQKSGEFAIAKNYYELYLSEHEGEDAYFTSKAEKEVKACDWAIDLLNNPDLSVEIERLGDGINTVYSEFGAVQTEEGLYFSALKFDEVAPKEKPTKKYSKILISEDLNESEVVEGDLNSSPLHTAHSCFNSDRSKIFYTICDYSDGLEIRCDIYYRDRLRDGEFGPEEKLPESINDPSFSNTQPNIGTDPVSGKEVLYFVSDRITGKGKLDIWSSVMETDGSFGIPLNLDAVNTHEDDITPFYDKENSKLYFSSEGYQRLGGFDIYSSSIDTEGDFSIPEHLPVPFNSSYHDLYYTTTDDPQTTFFSSNRPGSSFIDAIQQACCYDIYKAKITPVEITLNVLTYDKNTQRELPGTMVKLIDQGTGRILDIIKNISGNEHLFTLEKGRDYQLIAEKNPYKSDTILVSTRNIYESQHLVKRMYLELDMIMLDIFTFDKQTQEELAGVTVELLDLTDPNVDDQVQTNALYNDFQFKLKAGNTYKVTASKRNDYKPSSIIIDTSVDTGGGHIVKKIYLERRDLNIYLPLTLYFDNDRPNRKSIASSTNLKYRDTYFPYLGKKEYYKSRTGRGIQGEEKILEIQKMEDFFEFDVKGGYSKLDLFLSALLAELEKGTSLEIKVKGYASPLATSRYNELLGQRRVSSVRNEMAVFQNGIFKQYIDSGQLIITDISYGEQLAPSYVSDLVSDLQKSIYSTDASKERRAEIIEIKNSEE